MTKPRATPPVPAFERPMSLVDVVIFAVVDEALCVLLVTRAEPPFAGELALPGGFVDVDRDPDLEACARRKLKDKTGVDTPYLEQLGSWGGRSRDPRGWSTTHVYFALVPANVAAELRAGGNSADAQWMPLSGSGVAAELAFDHSAIVSAAVARLRNKVEYTSLPAFLLPREFTLTELQRAYEVVLDRPLEKSAFRTRMLAAKVVVETGKERTAASRPAQVYRLRSATKPVFFPRMFSGSR